MDCNFQLDLDILLDSDVPFENKRAMLDIIDEMALYRYHDGPRLIPELDFYSILFYNRDNFQQVWSFVIRFHTWIYSMALTSPEMTDQALQRLQAIRSEEPPKPVLNLDPSLIPSCNSPEQTPRGSEVEALTIPLTETPVSDWIDTNNQHPLLAAELEKPATFSYRCIIQDSEHFGTLDNAYENHMRKQAGQAPHDDPTWPATIPQQKEYIRRLFESITNMSNFYELRKAKERLGNRTGGEISEGSPVPLVTADQGHSQKRQRANKAGRSVDRTKPKGISKADWELMDPENSPVDLLAAIAHYRITDIEVELLCWRLLVAAMSAQRGYTMRPLWSGQRTTATWDFFETFAQRWEVICAQLLDCKLLVHSLTRAEWISKFAGAPIKERASKLNNDLLNGRRDVQNQVGREIIKAKTEAKEWTTSEDFEIRGSEGEIILKGGQIGDKARRQLAVRGLHQGAGSS